jgi:hypothetical protein
MTCLASPPDLIKVPDLQFFKFFFLNLSVFSAKPLYKKDRST